MKKGGVAFKAADYRHGGDFAAESYPPVPMLHAACAKRRGRFEQHAAPMING